MAKVTINNPFLSKPKSEALKNLVSVQANITADEAKALGIDVTNPEYAGRKFDVDFLASPEFLHDNFAETGSATIELYLRTKDSKGNALVPYVGKGYVSLQVSLDDPKRKFSIENLMRLVHGGEAKEVSEEAPVAVDGEAVA